MEEDARTQDRVEEAVSDDMDSDSGDCHMTPAVGAIVSDNYYTSLDGDAEEA